MCSLGSMLFCFSIANRRQYCVTDKRQLFPVTAKGHGKVSERCNMLKTARETFRQVSLTELFEPNIMASTRYVDKIISFH